MICYEMRLLALAAVMSGCHLPNSSAAFPALGEVRGVVLDSLTGSPVRGAQVWMVGRPVGATTNTLGEFHFPFYYGSQFTLVTRTCGRDNAATSSVKFSQTLASPIRIRITARPNQFCAPLLRPPWDVGPQDTTTFEGHVYNSWEGDSFITCAGKLFSPQWAPELLTSLWKGKRPEEGESRYVRVQARYDDDPSTRDFVGGPPLYVWRIIEVNKQTPAGCQHR
jgi:hypothetical protein